jgi:hypothetical protein
MKYANIVVKGPSKVILNSVNVEFWVSFSIEGTIYFIKEKLVKSNNINFFWKGFEFKGE